MDARYKKPHLKKYQKLLLGETTSQLVILKQKLQKLLKEYPGKNRKVFETLGQPKRALVRQKSQLTRTDNKMDYGSGRKPFINPAEKYVSFFIFYAMKRAWKRLMHENSALMLNNRFAIKLFDLESKDESIAKSVPLPVSIVPPV